MFKTTKIEGIHNLFIAFNAVTFYLVARYVKLGQLYEAIYWTSGEMKTRQHGNFSIVSPEIWIYNPDGCDAQVIDKKQLEEMLEQAVDKFRNDGK